MSKVSVREAALLVNRARDTINTATNNGTLSCTINARGHKEIDVSELERVYPLVRSIDEIRTSEPVRPTSGPTSGEASVQLAELRARLEGVENENQLLKEERSRERRQLESEIENLRASLEKAQDQHGRAMLLLSDQRKEEEGRAVERADEIRKLRKGHVMLRRQNERIQRELEERNSRTIWQRLWS